MYQYCAHTRLLSINPYFVNNLCNLADNNVQKLQNCSSTCPLLACIVSLHSQLYFLGSIDENSTFGSRFLFSIERSRPNFLGNRPQVWKTGILKKRMKTVANKTCFEVPRKNELVHVVKTGFNRLYIMFFKLLHDTCWPRRVFGSLWTERKLLKIWVAIVQALELQEDIESFCAFFTPLFFR